MTEQELNKACEIVHDLANEYFGDWEQSCKFEDKFRKAMEGISGNKEEIIPKYDADYLQSKIDAFTEARKKDGKAAEEVLEECRGGALELTWQDIREIVAIADDPELLNMIVLQKANQEKYYTEVLKRFKERNK